MAIKLSAAEWCYWRPEVGTDVYRRLKAAGYDAVELIGPEHWAPARAAGLKLLAIGAPGMQKGLNRVEHHTELLAGIREKLAAARENGIANVIVFSGCREGQSDEDGMRHCATALKALAPEAEAAGVTLILELLNTYDHADYQCASAAYAFGVAEAVGSPAVKVLYDIYHAHRMGEDVEAMIRRHVKWIGHLHVAGSPQRDFPGPEQAIDYRRLAQVAADAGYDGWWGMEFRAGDDRIEQYERAAQLFAGY